MRAAPLQSPLFCSVGCHFSHLARVSFSQLGFSEIAVMASRSSGSSRHPSVKWAQTSEKLFITIELPDAKDVKLKLEPEGKFIFSASKDDIPYVVYMELLDKIDVEDNKYDVGLRSIVYSIKKAEKKWWRRLLKQEGKPPVFLKVDWDKWADEDEENGIGFGV
ncbi:hypothetical protein Dimus_012423 [Dionaea muscipula]